MSDSQDSTEVDDERNLIKGMLDDDTRHDERVLQLLLPIIQPHLQQFPHDYDCRVFLANKDIKEYRDFGSVYCELISRPS
jgi:hypothetical protein